MATQRQMLVQLVPLLLCLFTLPIALALQQPINTYSRKDIDETEYIQLGLTPSKPLIIQSTNELGQISSKTYHGRFLHITDIHPDEYYKTGAFIDEACHRGVKKNKKGREKASKYGDALLGCDSPTILMDETLQWIETHLKDKIDFIIWTGDNIRHDNDRKIPRTENQIFEMNRKVSQKFIDAFGNPNSQDPRNFKVPVIPSLGNNDVFPHNLFSPGPTLQTRELWNIWQNFIPQEQLHVFERGAYFFQEVIPNKLAVLSINTLYLFKSNPLVDNCDKKKDPGYKLFQWLGVVLDELRDRKMKVWLSGHVPPVPKNYDLTCFRKYSIWLYEYRDIIIGGVYGHMNLDHFIPIDSQKAYNSFESSLALFETEESMEEDDDLTLEQQYQAFGIDLNDPYLDQIHIQGGPPSGKEEYMDSVRSAFYKDVKKRSKQGEHGERYSIINVAASVVPTFNPGFRVWEYNITELENEMDLVPQPWDEFFTKLDMKIKQDDEDIFLFDDDSDEFDDLDELDELDIDINKRKKKKKKGKKKKDDSLPPKKPATEPLGPGYTPQTFSPTKFVQYFLNLSSINQEVEPFDYKVEYKSDDEPYNLKRLLVQDYLKLARSFGKPLKKKSKGKDNRPLQKLWEKYLNHVFVSTGYHDE